MPENPLLRDPGFLEFLFPASTPWEIGLAVLAVIGVARSARTRDPLLLAFFVGAVVALAAFWRFTDGGPFFSMRVLPFWFIAKWVFAALGFAWLVTVGAARVRQRTAGDSDPRLAPVAWLALATVVIGFTWGWFGTTKAPTTSEPGSANILGFEVPVTSSAALRPVLAGFAARPDYPQLQSVQNLLREVAQKNGCGTLMWDAGDPAQEGGPIFGDAQVFWQSAIWTEGCIPAADGVLVDSSMTAPAMGMTKSMVSTTVERLLPGRPQFELDIAGEGAKRMQAMGIRYYLTHGGQPATDAATSKLLTLIARAGTWEIWEVNKGVPVASLANLPAVFEPTLSDSDWESLSTRYFTTPSFTTVPITQSGSSSWPKASLTALPQQTGTEPAGVFDIRLNDGRVTFSVQKVGKPVVVRLSAFPGWSVVGAEGPYRATANYMVVVPTSTTVTLTKGRTTIDWIAIISALLGLGLAVGVVVFRVLQSRGGAPEGHELEDADVDSDTLAGVLAASEDTSAEQV